MMEESINTQIAFEKFETEDVNMIENSTERLVNIKGAPKTVSRYRSDRIPSCHDACKYGFQHSAEAKPWSAAKKLITRGSKIKSQEEIIISVAWMKESTSSSNPPNSKLGKPSCPLMFKDQSSMDGTDPSEKISPPFESMDHGLNNIKKEQSEKPSFAVKDRSSMDETDPSEKILPPFEETEVSVDHCLSDIEKEQVEQPSFAVQDQSSMDGTDPLDKILPSFEGTDVSMDHGLSNIKKEQLQQPSLPVQECSNSQTNREIKKSKSPFGSRSKNKSQSRSKQGTSPIGHKKISLPLSSSLSSEHYLKKSASTTSKVARNLKGVSSATIQKNVEKVKPEPTSNGNVQAEILHLNEPTSDYIKPEPTIYGNLQEEVLRVDEPTSGYKSMELTLACDNTNLSSVSPSSSGDKSLKQDSEEIGKSGLPASSKKGFRHARHGIRPTKSRVPSLQSFGIKGKRRMQNTINASSSLSPLSQSASSRRTLRHADQGISPTKSLAPFSPSSGIKVKRHLQNAIHNASSASSPSSPLSQLKSSRRSFRHDGHGIPQNKSLIPSPESSGIKFKRHLQHTMHRDSPSSLSPSQTQSHTSPSNSSLRKQNGATSKSNKTGHNQPGENVKAGNKVRPKRSAIVGAGNKVMPVHKLGFRRGKVTEVQPQNNVPRRLKFRPPRLLSDTEREKYNTKKWISRRKDDDDKEESNDATHLLRDAEREKYNTRKRISRKKDADKEESNDATHLHSDAEREKYNTRKQISRKKDADKEESNDVKINSEKVVPRVQSVVGSKRRNFRRKALNESKMDSSMPESQQVVLRHQNAIGKKVTRRLYNNVIEETATKLAELRKSKVKALVGAFETVISLDSPRQEATPLYISTN